ncbi:MAG TPA: hypothetical protein VND99_03615 [Candidatus Acidoferrales bacterium]|nr:hypothetical protein [Candidatus Acidoferrales bacterium]
MVKELLSDLYKITQRSYQPDSFHPYIPMILTIITLTILAYGLQTTTATIHTYAVNPKSFTDTMLHCNDLTKTSLNYICKGVQSSGDNVYQSDKVLSFVQDLQSVTK